MDARTFRGAALGVTVTLALAVLLTLLWGIGSARTAKADDLDVCLSGCPYTTIRDAIYAAVDGDTIRVAAGTYTNTMVCDVWGSGTFTNTLCITEDITLLGGYDPTDFGNRDPDQYTTTVKWEGEPGHVVIDLVNGTSATLDGFEITGATGAPVGAIYVKDSAPTISHNRIVGNHSTGHGAGIYVSENSSPTIESNLILSNTADQAGGGIAMRWGATGVISGNVIERNYAFDGAGILVSLGSRASLYGNMIAHNQAGDFGGGVFVTDSSLVTVTNNNIWSNLANRSAGIEVTTGSTATIQANDIFSNSADVSGGGVVVGSDATVTLMENRIRANHAGGWAGGGILVGNGTAAILSNEIVSNTAPAGWGGAIRVHDGAQVTIAGNLIEGNSADGAPGIQFSDQASGVVDANLIRDNIVGEAGGIRLVGGSVVTITNNVIAAVERGVVIFDDPSQAWVVNNTIVGCTAEAVHAFDASTIFALNNIIAHNGAGVSALTPNAMVDYNDVWESGLAYWGVTPGPGSISADPQFVDAAAGDYHLAWGSTAINAGTNAGAPAYDKDGVPRPQMGQVDMGAYEQIGFGAFLPTVLRNAGQPASHE